MCNVLDVHDDRNDSSSSKNLRYRSFSGRWKRRFVLKRFVQHKVVLARTVDLHFPDTRIVLYLNVPVYTLHGDYRLARKDPASIAMLTASLQSTWEQKNRQARPKYGTYQSNYVDDNEGKGNAYQNQDRVGKSNNYSSQQAQQSSYSSHSGNRSGTNGPSEGGTTTELPNLKVPQVS